MLTDIEKEEIDIGKEQDYDVKRFSTESFNAPISSIPTNKILSVEEGTTVADAVALMQSKRIGSLTIVKDHKLVGILTERDILMKAIGHSQELSSLLVDDIMTPNPQTLRKGDEIAYVLNNMHVGGYRHIPIVDENNVPESMISIKDVVDWVLDHFPQEILCMTGEPFRGESSRDSG
jgi:CBS domain-containing protein